ncbi:MAG: hypothetical protein ACI93G_000704 [Hyphomonas sp.]
MLSGQFKRQHKGLIMHRSLLPLSLFALLAWQALAGTPLQEALAASPDGPLYIFDVIVQNDGADAMMRVDPTRPEGERLTVISPPRKDWSDDFSKQVKKMQADTDGDIWCSKLGNNIPDDAALESETATTATYTYAPRVGAEPGDMDDILKYLKGKVVVAKDDPAILSVEMVAEKPFRPLPIARISQFEMKVACNRAPDGRTHVARVNVDISGSAMMKDFSESERQTITNLKAVPESGMGAK